MHLTDGAFGELFLRRTSLIFVCLISAMAYKQHMLSRKRQHEFSGEGFKRPNDSFGGAALKGNARSARPLDSKLPIHLTLRAAKSVLRMPRYFAVVEWIVSDVARKHGVKIYRRANVGNHLHLAIKIPRVKRWAAFIRELTGRLGLALKSVMGGQKLWFYRPHTRLVRGWQKAFRIVKDYIGLNSLEAEGFISRAEIKTLKDLRLKFDG